MNAKQRRVAQREYTKKIGPKLLELRLLGASALDVSTFRSFGPGNTLRSVQHEIDAYRRKRK